MYSIILPIYLYKCEKMKDLDPTDTSNNAILRENSVLLGGKYINISLSDV